MQKTSFKALMKPRRLCTASLSCSALRTFKSFNFQGIFTANFSLTPKFDCKNVLIQAQRCLARANKKSPIILNSILSASPLPIRILISWITDWDHSIFLHQTDYLQMSMAQCVNILMIDFSWISKPKEIKRSIYFWRDHNYNSKMIICNLDNKRMVNS